MRAYALHVRRRHHCLSKKDNDNGALWDTELTLSATVSATLRTKDDDNGALWDTELTLSAAVSATLRTLADCWACAGTAPCSF